MATHYPGGQVAARDATGAEYRFVLTDSYDGVAIDHVESEYVRARGTRFTVHFDEAAVRYWRNLGVVVETPVVTTDPAELTASN
ncbi:hypothetical protein ACWDTP_34045 [Mycobacterium sp. NPDC003449]